MPQIGFWGAPPKEWWFSFWFPATPHLNGVQTPSKQDASVLPIQGPRYGSDFNKPIFLWGMSANHSRGLSLAFMAMSTPISRTSASLGGLWPGRPPEVPPSGTQAQGALGMGPGSRAFTYPCMCDSTWPWVKIQIVPPSEHPTPHQNSLKRVVHLPQNDTIGFDPQPYMYSYRLRFG